MLEKYLTCYLRRFIYDTGEVHIYDCVGVRLSPDYVPDKKRVLIKIEKIEDGK
jgi:hypothetical protein